MPTKSQTKDKDNIKATTEKARNIDTTNPDSNMHKPVRGLQEK